MKITPATHLIKIWILESFPENYTKEEIRKIILDRYKQLGDKLENVEVERVKEGLNLIKFLLYTIYIFVLMFIFGDPEEVYE